MPSMIVGEERGVKATLNYMLHGQGPSKILFVMGLASALDSWEYQVKGFVTGIDEEGNSIYDSRYQICVYDNRGIGLSSSPLGRYTTDMMALDALELVSNLGWTHLHLVGVSMGGMICQRLAVHMIDEGFKRTWGRPIPSLLSLTLAVTHFGGQYSVQPETGRKMTRKLLTSFTEERRTKRVLPILFSKRFLSDPQRYQEAFHGIKASRKMEGGKPHTMGFLGQLNAVNKHKTTMEELHMIRDSQVPVLVMTGDEDHLVDPRNSAELNEILRPVEYIVMPETGHAINAERAQEFNEAMFRHVERGEMRRTKEGERREMGIAERFYVADSGTSERFHVTEMNGCTFRVLATPRAS